MQGPVHVTVFGSGFSLAGNSHHAIGALWPFQGLLCILQRSPLESPHRTGVVWPRVRNARAPVCRSHGSLFRRGRDVDRNAAALIEAAERLPGRR